MEELFNNIYLAIETNPLYLFLSVALIAVLLYSILKKLMKLLIYVLVIIIIYFGYLYYIGVEIPNNTEELKKQIDDDVEKVKKQFEKTAGVVKKVETSAELAENLEKYKKIIISTQQKFPFASEKISQIKGKNFAVIIDEAHSSQTGESAETVREVLNNSAQVERESKAEDARKDIIDQIEEKMSSRQSSENLSYYAFTATPKEKTLRLFGKETDQGTFVPFHKYPMKQAIDEDFILDVLKNYTTYDTHFKIVQTSAADKSVDGKRAARAVMNYVDSHHLGFVEKSKIIVDHFH